MKVVSVLHSLKNYIHIISLLNAYHISKYIHNSHQYTNIFTHGEKQVMFHPAVLSFNVCKSTYALFIRYISTNKIDRLILTSFLFVCLSAFKHFFLRKVSLVDYFTKLMNVLEKYVRCNLQTAHNALNNTSTVFFSI